MKLWIKLVIAFVIVSFATIWLGAWTIALIPSYHWANFPAGVTWFAIQCAWYVGICLTISQRKWLNEWEDHTS